MYLLNPHNTPSLIRFSKREMGVSGGEKAMEVVGVVEVELARCPTRDLAAKREVLSSGTEVESPTSEWLARQYLTGEN